MNESVAISNHEFSILCEIVSAGIENGSHHWMPMEGTRLIS
jgi:hypothetical protein